MTAYLCPGLLALYLIGFFAWLALEVRHAPYMQDDGQ